MITHQYSLQEIAKALQGEAIIRDEAKAVIDDILIDSRRLVSQHQTLFFALHSKKNDGHHYIQELFKKGVRNFVVSQNEMVNTFPAANFVVVDDTQKALQDLSTFHRKKFNYPIIGVTGSNGKTIVKEWIFQLLQDDLRIVRSPKSYNSQIGVPISVWLMEEKYDMAVFEAGISEPGEMSSLQEIIKPNIGVFTNIGAAHDKNFISRIQKAGEKLKLFTHAEKLIYNPDYDEIREVIIRSEIGRNVSLFRWSRINESELKITKEVKEQAQTTIFATYQEEERSITIPFTDDASIENAMHCWAVMLVLGYEQSEIELRMMQLQSIAMRLELKEGINDCTIINDSYNSDVNSLAIALDFLNQQNQHQKKTLILSDIMQSNRSDRELYGEIARLIKKKNITKLVGVGEKISRMANLFELEKVFYATTDDFIRNNAYSGFHHEAILLKGARVFEFERISKAFQKKDHETVLEINLNALVQNLDFYRKLVHPTTKMMAMVKAFSYGSGGYEISNTLQYHNIDYLSVAYADEGVELRKAGIRTPIMVMNPDEQSFDAILKFNLEPEIYSFRILRKLKEAIDRNLLPKNKPVQIHLKLDTGMHRLGFIEEEIEEVIEVVTNNELIRVKSVFSHLAASDDPGSDTFTLQQIALFNKMSGKITQAFPYKILRHILNSAGISRFPDSQMDMVRIGISMYGIASDKAMRSKLHNVSTLKSSISQIKTINQGESVGYNRNYVAERKMKIATIPLGYADGLSRLLSNGNGHLILHGKKLPIVGNICMDMCMVDVTDVEVNEGDRIEVFGEQQRVETLAQKIGTIPYEILSGISRRVKRVYFHE